MAATYRPDDGASHARLVVRGKWGLRRLKKLKELPAAGGLQADLLWPRSLAGRAMNWSGGGAISHTVAPTTNTTYTANFRTQYYLTMTHGTGGTVSPASGWRNAGATVSISATPTNNTQVSYSFSGWTGSGTGSYSGTNNTASFTMTGQITETAAFTQYTVKVCVHTLTYVAE